MDVVQSVRMSDCGSEGRGFEPHLPPERSPIPHFVDDGILYFIKPGQVLKAAGS